MPTVMNRAHKSHAANDKIEGQKVGQEMDGGIVVAIFNIGLIFFKGIVQDMEVFCKSILTNVVENFFFFVCGCLDRFKKGISTLKEMLGITCISIKASFSLLIKIIVHNPKPLSL
jgi:hypothetical protein